MKCPFVIKVCSKCGELLVAYSSNFNKKKGGKWGLEARCKRCTNQYHAQYYKDNKEYKSQYNAQWYKNNKERMAQYNAQWYKDNKEYKSRYKAQWYKNNKEYKSQYNAQYYKKNKERIAQYNAQWYKDNKEYMAQYYKDNPHIFFNANNKRRQLEENQGRGIIKEQWLEMMLWFDFRCAYSGEYIGGDKNANVRSVDHIIALNKGGLNEIWNCVPMYKPYNSSKSDKGMEEWYRQQEFYSEERLIKIYEWIEYAYNKWGNLEE